MWRGRRKKILRGLALGLAIGAIVAPAAQAKLAYEPGELGGSPNAIVVDDGRANPDVYEAPAPVADYGRARPDVGPPAVPTSNPTVVADGFDWRDAGVGAALALGVMLLGAAGALVRRHGRLAGV